MRKKAVSEEFYIKDLNEYNSAIQTLSTSFKEIYYRGVNQASHSLIPGIARSSSNTFDETKEFQLFDAFKRRIAFYKNETYREYIGSSSLDNLETLAIAQHNGLKTRLLDWSTNPLSALWFACQPPYDSMQDEYCTVWALIAPSEGKFDRDKFFYKDNTKTETLKGAEHTMLYIPSIVHPRIKNQSGLFTVHRFDKSANNGSGKYIPLEQDRNFFQNKFDTEQSHSKSNSQNDWDLMKIVVNRNKYGEELLKNLRRFDIHVETIYPSLDSLGKRLNFDFETGFVQ